MICFKTQLYIAAEKKDSERVVELLENGADPNEESIVFDHQDNQYAKQTAMYATLSHDDSAILKSLLAYGGNIHIVYPQMYTVKEGTILEHAIARRDARRPCIVDCLVKAGANVNRTSYRCNVRYESSALHLTSYWNLIDIARVLIMAGANVDFADRFGNTLAHTALLLKNCQMLSLLVVAGADLNIKQSAYVEDWHWKAGRRLTAVDRDLAATLIVGGATFQRTPGYFAPLDACQMIFEYKRNYPWQGQEAFLTFITDQPLLLEKAKQSVKKARYDLIKERAIEVCIALQDLQLDANRLCYIVIEACAPFAYDLAFHNVWNLVVKIKHWKPTTPTPDAQAKKKRRTGK